MPIFSSIVICYLKKEELTTPEADAETIARLTARASALEKEANTAEASSKTAAAALHRARVSSSLHEYNIPPQSSFPYSYSTH